MRKFLTMLLVSLVALALWAAPSYASVEFGGQYRLRMESWSETDFVNWPRDFNGGSCVDYAPDDSPYAGYCDDSKAYYGQRVRLWGIAKPTDDTTIKLTIQDTRYWGAETGRAYENGGPNLTDEGFNVIDLHESWLQINDLFNTPIAVKMGRQELAYGDQRLVGNFDWSNYGRSFDAIKFMYASDMFDVDVWTSKISDASAPQFDACPGCGINAAGPQDNDQDFYGVHATFKNIPNNALDLYVLYLRDGSAGTFVANNTLPLGLGSFPGGSIESQQLWTYGARLKGAFAGVDYTAEVPFQTGEINTRAGGTADFDISAWAAAARVGYTIPGGPMGLRVGAEYVFASGDDDPMDSDIDTFSNLFPTNHSHMGFMDQQGWRNTKSWNLNVSANPLPKLTARLDYWDFKLAEEEDFWYGAGNWMNAPLVSCLRTPGECGWTPGELGDDLGNEVDLTVNYAYNSAVNFQAGYSRFFAGDYIADYVDDTGGCVGSGWCDDEDQDWAYLQVTANF